MTKKDQKLEKDDHYYMFSILLGSRDFHIIPHPTKEQVKDIVIPHLKELIKLLKKEYKI